MSEGYQRAESSAVTSTSSGASCVPGAANVKGAYTQLIASTAFLYKMMMVTVGWQQSAARVDSSIRIDIAVGAAASEVIVLPDIHVNQGSSTSLTLVPRKIGPFPVHIPKASRIAARIQQSVITTPTNLDVAVIGFG